MSQFSGKHGKGAMKTRRIEKRTDAMLRDQRPLADYMMTEDERLLRAIFGSFSPTADTTDEEVDNETHHMRNILANLQNEKETT